MQSILAGCMMQNDPIAVREVKIRVLDCTELDPDPIVASQKNAINQASYFDLYRFQHPKVTFELEQLSALNTDLLAAVNSANPPDLLMINAIQFQELIDQNLLAPLDPLIQKTNTDLESITPTILQALKNAGNGTLYGLAPFYSAKALIYNKNEFADAAIAPLQDGMTRKEVFEKARVLTKGQNEQKVAGLALGNSDLFDGLTDYVNAMQLNIFDRETYKMTVNSEEWVNVFKEFSVLKAQGIFPSMNYVLSGNAHTPFAANHFISGRAAMAIIDLPELNRLIYANKKYPDLEYIPKNWGIVSLPVISTDNSVGSNIQFEGLMVINAKSGHQDEVWEVIRSINSDEWAKLKTNSSLFLSTHENAISVIAGSQEYAKAFSKTMPVVFRYDPEQLERNDWRYMELRNIGRNYFNQVLDGKIEIKSALENWSREGQVVLVDIISTPSRPNPMSSY